MSPTSPAWSARAARRVMRYRRVSRARLHALLGTTTHKTIHAWLNGVARPGDSDLRELARVLRVPRIALSSCLEWDRYRRRLQDRDWYARFRRRRGA